MKKFFSLFIVAVLGLATMVTAQEPTCYYRLVMEDLYNDGWDGNGQLKITEGSVEMYYRCEGGESPKTVNVPYYGGSSVELTWVSGSFTSENTITVYAPNGRGLFYHPSGSSMSDGDLLATLTSGFCDDGPNPDAPKNVTGELQSDRTLLVNWDAVTGADHYKVTIITPSGATIVSGDVTSANSYRTDNILSKSGDYTITVASVASSGLPMGETTTVVNVTVPKITSVKISALVPSDCGMEVSDGVWLCWFESQYAKQNYVKMTDKGNRRFEASFNPNASKYGFVILNKPSATDEDVHFTIPMENQYQTEICGEVILSPKRSHEFHSAACDAPDHDYRPINLKATPLSEDSVLFEWEVVSKAVDYKLYLLLDGKQEMLEDIYSSETSLSYKAKLYLPEPTKCSWMVRSVDSEGYGYETVGNEFTTLSGNNYMPHDVKVSDNGDDTYTITWEATADPHHYDVEINGVHTVAGNLRTYTTGTLSASSWNVYVIAYDEHDNVLGFAETSFSNTTITAKDYTLYFYIPEIADMSSEDYAILWGASGVDNKQTAVLTSIGSNWYSVTLAGLTKQLLDVRLLNAKTESAATIIVDIENPVYTASGVASHIIANKNKKGERFLSVINEDYFMGDFMPKNVQAEGGAGRMTVSWETVDAAPYYHVEVYDQSGIEIMESDYTSSSSSVTFAIPTDTAMLVSYVIVPHYDYYGYDSQTACFATEKVTIQPSSLNPRDLQVSQNPDGTYTVSWKAAEDRHVSEYYVRVNDPSGNWVADGSVGENLSYNIGTCALAGVYEVMVYAQAGSLYGFARTTFMVEPVDPHDITVRVLIHPDSELDTSGDVFFQFYDYDEDGWSSVKATREGTSYWYTATYSVITPSTAFRMGSYQYVCSDNACFEYCIGGRLRPVACTAEPHDYRIIYGSLDANSVPGAVTFYWDAEDMAQSYYLHLYDEYDSQFFGTYVYGEKSYLYRVPNGRDGQKITWRVTPYDGYNSYPTAQYTTPITLQKSNVAISGLKLTTKDSLTLDMEWVCDTKPMDFLIEVRANGNRYKVDTVKNDTSYHYQVPGVGEYSYSVCAVDPTTHAVIGPWSYSPSLNLYAKEYPDLITNLKGKSSGHTLTFTWETQAPQVYANIRRYNESSGYFNVFKADSVLTAKTWVYETEIEGLYQIEIYPMIEYLPGQYSEMAVTRPYTTTATSFTGKTFKVEITTSEGGMIYPAIEAGNYPDGFEFEVTADPSSLDYRFVKWSDGVTERHREFVVHSDLVLNAIFELSPKHTVTLNVEGNGSLYIENYMYGSVATVVTYTAECPEYDYPLIAAYPQPEPGYTFYQWSNGSTAVPYTYFGKEDVTLTAIFKPICHLTVPASTGGSVSVDGYISVSGNVYAAAYGNKLVMTAVPETDYRFVGWSDGVKTLQREIALVGDSTISATFEDATSIPKYAITIGTVDDGMGGGMVNIGSDNYYEGDQLLLIATPYWCSKFVKWSDGVTDNPRTYTVSAVATINAEFAIQTFAFEATASEGGTITGDPSGTYHCDDYISVKAVPEAHYHFVKWSDGYDNPDRALSISQDTSIQAIFEIDKYMITFVNDDGSFIEVGQWGYNTTPTCSVKPTKKSTAQYSYSFKAWSPAIEKVTKEAVYKATYNQNTRTYTVTFLDWNGDKLKTEEVAYGESATAPTAPTRAGYTFTGWDKDFSNITEDLTVTAQYKPGSQSIDNTNAEGAARKVVEGDHIYIIMPDGRKYSVLGDKIK